jgi:diaminohydroxyphosphoribosylaminopyrimidine deaminase/5-amino-6-(5-phosphoribosylamino)uracil reductase
MKALHGIGVLHVLCEGGAGLAASLIRAKLVDELILFIAPVVIGGDGVAAISGAGWPLANVPRMRIVETRQVGDDVMIRALTTAD